MTKFQKYQKISSIIPIISTAFVVVTTMTVLSRRKIPFKLWLRFLLVFFVSCFAVYSINAFVMTGQNPFLNVMVSALILAGTNILSVDIQIDAEKYEKKTSCIDVKTIVIVATVVAFALLAVSIIVLVFSVLTPAVDIQDINGTDDTSLAVIDDAKILSTDDHYSALGCITSQSGDKTNVTGRFKKSDHDSVRFLCRKISGVMTLQATKPKQNQISLEIVTQSEVGNLEIAIIIDGEIFEMISANESKTIILSEVADKTVLVKLAGESACVDVSVKRFLA